MTGILSLDKALNRNLQIDNKPAKIETPKSPVDNLSEEEPISVTEESVEG